MPRHVVFYKTASGNCPVVEFLDLLSGKDAQKITWVLSLVEELNIIPKKYFKKLEGFAAIYECRIDSGGNTYRLLGFFHKGNYVVLTNGFMKKSKKTPKDEIDLCIRRMNDFIVRGGII